MFFECKIGSEVRLINLAQVAHIKITPPSDDLSTVTFYFTHGGEETVRLNPTVLQRLSTAIPRPSMYGTGGMG
jgi:hypothetical protein